jgi:hypothetical protein
MNAERISESRSSFILHRSAFVLALALAACTSAPRPAAQNPSPMVDNTRAHQRLARRELATQKIGNAEVLFGSGDDLLIHFHGAAWVAMQAAGDRTMAVVNLGAGSGVYEKAFADPTAFTQLVQSLHRPFKRIYISGFSAGYGAVRAILRNHADEIEGVMLLDGIHTSYPFDATKLEPFLAFARRAVAGEKAMVITHSEIFPGTFASTTECTDYLIAQLGLRRTPVIKWGPGGMQQLSEVRAGRLVILGFAGNSAPDHIDHLHGMPTFVELLR